MYNGCSVPEEKSLFAGCRLKALIRDARRGEGLYGGGIYIHGVVVAQWDESGRRQSSTSSLWEPEQLTPTQPKTTSASLWCNAQVGCVFDVGWKSVGRQMTGKKNNRAAQSWKLGRRAVGCRSTADFLQACCMEANPCLFTAPLVVTYSVSAPAAAFCQLTATERRGTLTITRRTPAPCCWSLITASSNTWAVARRASLWTTWYVSTRLHIDGSFF